MVCVQEKHAMFLCMREREMLHWLMYSPFGSQFEHRKEIKSILFDSFGTPMLDNLSLDSTQFYFTYSGARNYIDVETFLGDICFQMMYTWVR